MKEHRELPRIGTGDPRPETVAPEALVPTPLLELEWRKTSPPKDYRRMVIFVTAALGLFFVGWFAVGYGRSRLSDQPIYQIPFNRIQLEPAPPVWYRGGAEAFLESIRQRAGQPETLRFLELKENEVEQAFLQSPWVERVVRVWNPPLGLRVDLQYRQPVVRVRVSATKEEYLLDEAGIVLSWDDVDPDRLGTLILIAGERLSGPLDARAGLAWKSPPGVHDVSAVNERIRSAARLAGFLARKMEALGAARPAALDFGEINPMDPHPRGPKDPRPRGLFIFNKAHCCFLWGEAPGEESPQDLSAEEKWAALYDWSRGTQEGPLPRGDYWTFSKTGLVRVYIPRHPEGPSSDPPTYHQDSSAR